jgi:transposase-like protein
MRTDRGQLKNWFARGHQACGDDDDVIRIRSGHLKVIETRRLLHPSSGCELASANPTKERKMEAFKSQGSAERFLSTHAAVYNIFNVQRYLTSASTHRAFRASAMNSWRAAVTVA